MITYDKNESVFTQFNRADFRAFVNAHKRYYSAIEQTCGVIEDYFTAHDGEEFSENVLREINKILYLRNIRIEFVSYYGGLGEITLRIPHELQFANFCTEREIDTGLPLTFKIANVWFENAKTDDPLYNSEHYVISLARFQRACDGLQQRAGEEIANLCILYDEWNEQLQLTRDVDNVVRTMLRKVCPLALLDSRLPSGNGDIRMECGNVVDDYSDYGVSYADLLDKPLE